MKNIKIRPFRLLGIGAVIVIIGAIAKITKENFAQPILIVGILVELVSIILIFKLLAKLNKFS